MKDPEVAKEYLESIEEFINKVTEPELISEKEIALEYVGGLRRIIHETMNNISNLTKLYWHRPACPPPKNPLDA